MTLQSEGTHYKLAKFNNSNQTKKVISGKETYAKLHTLDGPAKKSGRKLN